MYIFVTETKKMYFLQTYITQISTDYLIILDISTLLLSPRIASTSPPTYPLSSTVLLTGNFFSENNMDFIKGLTRSFSRIKYNSHLLIKDLRAQKIFLLWLNLAPYSKGIFYNFHANELRRRREAIWKLLLDGVKIIHGIYYVLQLE